MKKSLSVFLTIALFLAFAVFALGSGSSNNEPKVEKNDAAQNATVEASKAPENKRVEIRVGETLNLNELKITFDSAETWSSNNQFLQPKSGKQYIRLHITAQNDTKADAYVSTFNFDCYANGEKCDAFYVGEDEFSGASISPGRKTSGYLYFEVPIGAAEIEVEYETNIWNNQKAFFIVEL